MILNYCAFVSNSTVTRIADGKMELSIISKDGYKRENKINECLFLFIFYYFTTPTQ